MKDELKSFVEANRGSFDLYSIDEDALWGDIDQQLEGKRKMVWNIAWKIAASVLLVMGVGWMFYLNDYNSQTGQMAEGVSLHEISPEMAETELYYTNQINEKIHIIQSSNPEIGKEVFEGLSILDTAYMELKQDLKDNADNEEVINAMIQNYRIKLELLEQILKEINEKNENNNKYEDAHI